MLAVSEWRRRFVDKPGYAKRTHPVTRWGEASLALRLVATNLSTALAAALVKLTERQGQQAVKSRSAKGGFLVKETATSRFTIIFVMEKATFALMNWNTVRAFSLAENSIHVITDDGRSQDFHFSTNEDARKAFNARSGSRAFPPRRK